MPHRSRRVSIASVLLSTIIVAVPLLFERSAASAHDGAEHAESKDAVSTKPSPQAPEESTAAVLGADWFKSKDVAFSGYGDGEGYHVLKGIGSEGFTWRPLATIQPDGITEEAWTGYQCTTGSGKYVVLAIAPARYSNIPVLRDRGALAYVIDTDTGRVRTLTSGVSLKYHTPGCGAEDTAVLTRSLDIDQVRTEVLVVDAKSATIKSTGIVDGQLTSAVPLKSGAVAAAMGSQIVQLNGKGFKPSTVAKVAGQPFALVPSGNDLAFLSADGETSTVFSLRGAKLVEAGKGPRTKTGLYLGRSGKALVTGIGSLPADVNGKIRSVDIALEKNDQLPVALSLDGEVSISRATAEAKPAPSSATSTRTKKKVATGSPGDASSVATELPPVVGNGVLAAQSTPSEPGQMVMAAANTTTPKCAVPRNALNRQVLQPGHQQVEWAVNQSVRNNLTTPRPTNYMNMGLASYAPNTDFPRRPLTNAPSTPVPPNVMEAIIAQESNFSHASWHALPGVGGNPLIGDYYGSAGDINNIDYDGADCGYGIGQVTTGMRTVDTTYSANGKAKIAVDYAENIAVGLQILQEKWNQLQSIGVTANNNDPKYLENWYFAIWGYNTGVYTTPDADGMKGLGWTNNPQNADYNPTRVGYLRVTYADAAHPADWPYQERVMGWMETPLLNYKGVSSYSKPTYSGNSPSMFGAPILSLPGYSQFCNASNACSTSYVNGSQSYCQLPGRNCRWSQPTTYAQCDSHFCALGTFKYATTDPEPGVTNPQPPACTSTLPSNAKIVDDIVDPSPNVVGCGAKNWTTAGSFQLTQGTDSSGVPVSVIDTHQLGAGLGGHIYFTHNRSASDVAHRVTGTWTPATLAAQSYHVMTHVPSTGASTGSAKYQITTANGSVSERAIDQHLHQNRWVSLGYHSLGSNAKVVLDNVTSDASTGKQNVRWDAVAFIPVSGTIVTHALDAVSIFDFNQDINTSAPWMANTPLRTMSTLQNWAIQYSSGGPCWNGSCQGTYQGILSNATCSGAPNSGCVLPATRAAAQSWYNDAVAGGNSTTNNSPSMSQAKWMGFDAPTPPTSITSSTFANDESYKIKNHIDVSFLVSNGTIVPGSESATYNARTGNTHLAPFLKNLITGISSDYGIPLPNLSFSAQDMNKHNGETVFSDPLITGITPGRDYAPHSDPAKLLDNNTCVGVKSVNGGSIGYRVLAAQPSVRIAMEAWVESVKAKALAGQMPQSVADTASELYTMFFKKGFTNLDGTPFYIAPPIWQQVNAKVCVDGSVKTTGSPGGVYNQIAEQSYMPDLYLYKNGNAINQSGGPSSGPVQTADFYSFSNIPAAAPNGNPFGACGFASYGLKAGNPWSIGPLDSADIRPTAVSYCDVYHPYGHDQAIP